ncbi:MAG: hypothetical protein GTN99_08255, partial [Candidatus Dadabacteria bacterium]|nr:hypothetical protein [Candidatus Dadabacteria bacterium]NIT14213.1 hypothetical protein [Candidatus Dadabacteria bacterium]
MASIDANRRKFLKNGFTGLGIVLSGKLLLSDNAYPTENSGDLDEYI